MPKVFMVVESEGGNTKRINDFMLQVATAFRPDLMFEREQDAIAHAQKLAMTNVGREIFILESKSTVSARKPTIIHKKFNENGELVPA